MRELQYEKRDEQSNMWGIAGQASERAGMRDGLTSVGVVEVERLYLSWDKLVVGRDRQVGCKCFDLEGATQKNINATARSAYIFIRI